MMADVGKTGLESESSYLSGAVCWQAGDCGHGMLEERSIYCSNVQSSMVLHGKNNTMRCVRTFV